MPEAKGKHLTKENREVIEIGLRSKSSSRKIAKRIDVNQSTATREDTARGKRFAEDISNLLRLYDEAIKQLNSTASPEGSFALKVLPVSGLKAFEVVKTFTDKNPQIKVDFLGSKMFSDTADAIRNGTIDCGIYGHWTRKPSIDDGLLAIPCTKEELVLWIDRESPFINLDKITPQCLNGTSMPTPLGLGSERTDTMHKDFIDAYNLNVNLVSRYFESQENYFLTKIKKEDVVLLHKGYAETDVIRIREDRVIRSFDPPIYNTSYILFPREITNPAIQHFVDYLLEQGSAFADNAK